MGYDRTLASVETYFDKTATRTWERLTSDVPVSKIRQTVRKGRDQMRAAMIYRLPNDLRGTRILDAGCGAGQMTAELAERGAHVVAADISPALLSIAKNRLPKECLPNVTFHHGDMLSIDLGRFDYVMAMDSLIYYDRADIAKALAGLAARTGNSIVFTVAPKTAMLSLMWRAGQLFPRSDRSPTMVPHDPASLSLTYAETGAPGAIYTLDRITSGFYISQAMEVRK